MPVRVQIEPLMYALPGPPGSIGRLVIEVAGRMNSSVLSERYVPKASINGSSPLTELRRGTTVITMPAGHYNLVVGVGSNVRRRRFVYGTARTAVPIYPHQTTTVYYHAPWLLWSKGAIGPTPQEAPDKFRAGCVLAVATACAVQAIGYTLLDALNWL